MHIRYWKIQMPKSWKNKQYWGYCGAYNTLEIRAPFKKIGFEYLLASFIWYLHLSKLTFSELKHQSRETMRRGQILFRGNVYSNKGRGGQVFGKCVFPKTFRKDFLNSRCISPPPTDYFWARYCRIPLPTIHYIIHSIAWRPVDNFSIHDSSPAHPNRRLIFSKLSTRIPAPNFLPSTSPIPTPHNNFPFNSWFFFF